MNQRRRQLSIVASIVLAIGLLLIGYLLRVERSPNAWTGGNLLPNADFAAGDGNAATGWRFSGDARRTSATENYVLTPPYALYLRGSNSWIRTPELTVHAGQRYRIGFQALVDPGKQTGDAPTRLIVWTHWIDAAGDDVRIDKSSPFELGYDANNEPTWTSILHESESAPANADRIAFSIHPVADEVILLDEFALNAAGVYLQPWPNGARAAISFSVDWETAMGGFVHSRSADPAAATQTGLRSREGTANLLALLRQHNLAATWFSNGYNFLGGNTTGRTWMDDPVFAWATAANGWRTDWSQRRWFSPDPHGTVATNPAWYFGDLIEPLAAANQPIESHSFSHLYVGLATLAQWQADLTAWIDVAREQHIAPASAFAFPWGSSGGMTDGHWQALQQAGIDTVVRTHLPNDLGNTSDPVLLVDRTRYQPRLLPGHNVLALPDAYLLPQTRADVLSQLAATVEVGGVIDIWAHTYEITSPDEIAVWRDLIDTAAASGGWIASVPDIAAWWRGVRQIEMAQQQDGDTLHITLRNAGATTLHNLTLTLPAAIDRSESLSPVTQTNDRLVLDLAAGATVEITVWLKP